MEEERKEKEKERKAEEHTEGLLNGSDPSAQE